MTMITRNTIRLSLTPGFSQVSGAGGLEKPFQRFLRASKKPLKRFACHTVAYTRLKPGVNEKRTELNKQFEVSVTTNFRLQRCCALCVLLAFLTAFVGCGRGPQFLGSIQSAGGVDALKKECNDLASNFPSPQLRSIDETNYPPTIAKLNPQIVQIIEHRSFTFVHIQISGGFSHAGLLISGQALPPDFVPVRGGGGKWPVWKIADGVFEYRE
jgi:hypothetical protein